MERTMNYELKFINKGRILLSLFIIVYSLFFTHYFALAQPIDFTTNLGNYPGGVFSVTSLLNLFGRLTCYLIQFAVIAVGVAFIVYGIMFLTSRGEAQGFSRSKKAITWGVVGGLVIFSVFTIVLTVASFIGVNYNILTIVRCQ